MTKNVLAVDDNRAALILYEVCFRDSANYQLFTENNPINAFHVIDRKAHEGTSIDLLITDLNMLELSGFDLIRNVRVVSPNTKFMLQSGREEAEVMRLIASLRNEGIEVRYLPPAYLWDTEKLLGEVKSLIGD